MCHNNCFSRSDGYMPTPTFTTRSFHVTFNTIVNSESFVNESKPAGASDQLQMPKLNVLSFGLKSFVRRSLKIHQFVCIQCSECFTLQFNCVSAKIQINLERCKIN